MQIHDLNTKALTDPAYVAFDDGTDTYKVEFNDTVESAAQDAVAEADLTQNTVGFTSGDSLSPSGWTSVPQITTDSTLATLFNRISTMVKNVRYIWNLLGSSSFSNVASTLTGAIGNTALTTTAQTLSGAIAEHESDISTLNSKLSQMIMTKTFVCDNISITAGTPGTRGGQNQVDVAVDGYTPISVGLAHINDSSLANVIPFFGSRTNPNTVYVNAYRASGNAGNVTEINFRVIYIKS